MRLLHSTHLKLVEFMERDLPPYAILSHTWEMEEVSFQEMQTDDAKSKKGYSKIKGCCKVAAAWGFEYVWVDTCCIDKTSSAELSEAINSMFSWYQKADVCYVYLSDYLFPARKDNSLDEEGFKNSRWFTRGWTLQELIAPESVIFFNNTWHDIGTKHSLGSLISEITEIQVEALMGAKLEDFSVAQRMCWASRRQTSRIEDEAYSLMGVFGVHMPMLYGEGVHAFIRLQEEIIKTSTDHTIFAWATEFPPTRFYTGGLLADCPSTFANTKWIVPDSDKNTLPFEITNKGIHLRIPIYEDSYGVLDCHDLKKPGFNLAIKLTKTPNSSDTLQFDEFCGTVSLAAEDRQDLPTQSIYVARGTSLVPSLPPRFHDVEFYFQTKFTWGRDIRATGSFPPNLTRNNTEIGPGTGFGALLIAQGLYYTCAVIVNTTYPGQFEVRVVDETSNDFYGAILPSIIIKEYQSWLKEAWKERHVSWKRPLDRFRWQHPRKLWWITVATSRAIRAGKRIIIVTIEDG
ncbi:HET-domain-containing protein [Hyaloscypha hepaticicola]|uniref:HET-domain-containing protein n=1 Tax=Hyaloscypha hepaticicola TaxID=2082293 RepID=A0A2J6Q151_9HELO|nr:HET-domain-containing protein [Hyaloscypha hepaticicola]